MILALLLACGTDASIRAGETALDQGDLRAAETAYRSALDREPTRVEALYGIGWTWHLAGQRDAARGAFDQLVLLHPESPLGYKGLGSVAMAEGNTSLARNRFEEALDRAPGDFAIRQSVGLLALSTGDATSALATFDALAAESPDRAEIHHARAEALLLLDREEEALTAATEAVRLARTGKVAALARVTRGRALLAHTAGRVDKDRCAETAAPIHAWLDAAEHALDEAEALKIDIPELAKARQQASRRRGFVDDACPGFRPPVGSGFPDG